jgi:hypothetical protein
MFLTTTGWLALTAATLVYRLIKFIVFAGILWGAFQQLTPFPQYDSSHGLASPLAYVFSYSAVNWFPLLATVSLLYILSCRKSIQYTEQRVSGLTIGMVALLDYFKIEVETTATRELARDGALKTFWRSIRETPLRIVLGSPKDEYTAKAARRGAEVNFESDLRDFLHRN